MALSDLWLLRRKPHNQLVLHTASLLVQPYHPLWFALRCLLNSSGRDYAMRVFHDRGLRAFIQARGRNGRPEQDIISLASYGVRKWSLPSDYDIWFRLLERHCLYAGQNHIQRLYASVWEQQEEAREIFRQLGFQPYVNHVVLQLSGPDWDQGTTLAPMRVQSRQDAWAIHKLYGAVTSHHIQYAEVRTPRAWMLPMYGHGMPRLFWQGHYRRGWVLGPSDNLEAYLHLISGPKGYVFTLLIRPDVRENATSVLRFGLAQLSDNRPVYLLLREQQQELLAPAQNLGFQPIGDQTLMVKSTVVSVGLQRSVTLPLPAVGSPRVVPLPQITIPRISAPREDSHL